jgi:threonine/homoserine/homoserine lactone efflux protein
VPDPLPFITYAFVMSITPGPNNVMLTVSGANFGFRRTLPHLFGVVFGFARCSCWRCVPGAERAVQPLAGTADDIELGRSRVPGVPRLAPCRSSSDSARPAPAARCGSGKAAMFQFLNPKAWVMSITSATLFPPQELGLLLRGAYMATVMEVVGVPCMTA